MKIARQVACVWCDFARVNRFILHALEKKVDAFPYFVSQYYVRFISGLLRVVLLHSFPWCSLFPYRVPQSVFHWYDNIVFIHQVHF